MGWPIVENVPTPCGTGVCEKRCHPTIPNSMRVGPFPLKVKVDACVRKAWGLQTWYLFSLSPCIRKLYASTLTLRGKGSTRTGSCIKGWHLFSQTPVPKKQGQKKEGSRGKKNREQINSSRHTRELFSCGGTTG